MKKPKHPYQELQWHQKSSVRIIQKIKNHRLISGAEHKRHPFSDDKECRTVSYKNLWPQHHTNSIQPVSSHLTNITPKHLFRITQCLKCQRFLTITIWMTHAESAFHIHYICDRWESSKSWMNQTGQGTEQAKRPTWGR